MTEAPPAGRTLHVAAMPFPSPQGTQAAVRSMLDALGEAGRESHLLTYGHGAGPIGTPSFGWHRLPGLPGYRSLRSGPSLHKVALDLRMIGAVRRLHARLGSDLVVAHHVEACAAALAAGIRPVLFVAHTALDAELPVYLPPFVSRPAERAGAALDRWLARRADAAAAVSPALASHLSAHSGRAVHALPIPWAVPPPITGTERRRARARLGLGRTTHVAVYAGNLDAYQGWELLLEALARVAAPVSDAVLLVATPSPAGALREGGRRLGVTSRLRVLPLTDEGDRRLAHAAADLALVPRRSPGGLPVKLLDAMARGIPVLATRRAIAALPLGTAAMVVRDDDPDAFANAWAMAARTPTATMAAGARGRAYVTNGHGAHHFVRAFDRAAADLPGAR